MFPLLVVATAVGLNVVSTHAAPVPSKFETRDYSKRFPRGISDGDPSKQPQSSVPQAIDGSVPAHSAHRSLRGLTDFPPKSWDAHDDPPPGLTAETSSDLPLNSPVGSKNAAIAQPSKTSLTLPHSFASRLAFFSEQDKLPETSPTLPRNLKSRLAFFADQDKLPETSPTLPRNLKSRLAFFAGQGSPTPSWPDNKSMPINDFRYLLSPNTKVPFRIGPPGGPEGHLTLPPLPSESHIHTPPGGLEGHLNLPSESHIDASQSKLEQDGAGSHSGKKRQHT